MSNSDIESLTKELQHLKILVSDLEKQIATINASSTVQPISVGSKVRVINPSRVIEHTSSATVYKIKVFPYYHHIIFPDNSKSRRIARNLKLVTDE